MNYIFPESAKTVAPTSIEDTPPSTLPAASAAPSIPRFIPGASNRFDCEYDQMFYTLYKLDRLSADGFKKNSKPWPSLDPLSPELLHAIDMFLSNGIQITCNEGANFYYGTLQFSLLLKRLAHISSDLINVIFIGSALQELCHKHGWTAGNIQKLLEGHPIPEGLLQIFLQKTAGDSDWRVYMYEAQRRHIMAMSEEVVNYLTDAVYWSKLNDHIRSYADEQRLHKKNICYRVPGPGQYNPREYARVRNIVKSTALNKFKLYESEPTDPHQTSYTTISFPKNSAKQIDLMFIKKLAREHLFLMDDLKLPMRPILDRIKAGIPIEDLVVFPVSDHDPWQFLMDQYCNIIHCLDAENVNEKAYLKTIWHLVCGARILQPDLEKIFLEKVKSQCVDEGTYNEAYFALMMSMHIQELLGKKPFAPLVIGTLISLKDCGISNICIHDIWQRLLLSTPAKPEKTGFYDLVLAFAKEALSVNHMPFDALYDILHLHSYLNLAGHPATTKYCITMGGAFRAYDSYALTTKGKIEETLQRLIPFFERDFTSLTTPCQNFISQLLLQTHFDHPNEETALKFHREDVPIDYGIIQQAAFTLIEKTNCPFSKKLGYALLLVCHTNAPKTDLSQTLLLHFFVQMQISSPSERLVLLTNMQTFFKDTPLRPLFNLSLDHFEENWFNSLVAHVSPENLKIVRLIWKECKSEPTLKKLTAPLLIKKVASFNPNEGLSLFAYCQKNNSLTTLESEAILNYFQPIVREDTSGDLRSHLESIIHKNIKSLGNISVNSIFEFCSFNTLLELKMPAYAAASDREKLYLIESLLENFSDNISETNHQWLLNALNELLGNLNLPLLSKLCLYINFKISSLVPPHNHKLLDQKVQFLTHLAYRNVLHSIMENSVKIILETAYAALVKSSDTRSTSTNVHRMLSAWKLHATPQTAGIQPKAQAKVYAKLIDSLLANGHTEANEWILTYLKHLPIDPSNLNRWFPMLLELNQYSVAIAIIEKLDPKTETPLWITLIEKAQLHDPLIAGGILIEKSPLFLPNPSLKALVNGVVHKIQNNPQYDNSTIPFQLLEIYRIPCMQAWKKSLDTLKKSKESALKENIPSILPLFANEFLSDALEAIPDAEECILTCLEILDLAESNEMLNLAAEFDPTRKLLERLSKPSLLKYHQILIKNICRLLPILHNPQNIIATLTRYRIMLFLDLLKERELWPELFKLNHNLIMSLGKSKKPQLFDKALEFAKDSFLTFRQNKYDLAAHKLEIKNAIIAFMGQLKYHSKTSHEKPFRDFVISALSHAKVCLSIEIDELAQLFIQEPIPFLHTKAPLLFWIKAAAYKQLNTTTDSVDLKNLEVTLHDYFLNSDQKTANEIRVFEKVLTALLEIINHSEKHKEQDIKEAEKWLKVSVSLHKQLSPKLISTIAARLSLKSSLQAIKKFSPDKNSIDEACAALKLFTQFFPIIAKEPNYEIQALNLNIDLLLLISRNDHNYRTFHNFMISFLQTICRAKFQPKFDEVYDTLDQETGHEFIYTKPQLRMEQTSFSHETNNLRLANILYMGFMKHIETAEGKMTPQTPYLLFEITQKKLNIEMMDACTLDMVLQDPKEPNKLFTYLTIFLCKVLNIKESHKLDQDYLIDLVDDGLIYLLRHYPERKTEIAELVEKYAFFALPQSKGLLQNHIYRVDYFYNRLLKVFDFKRAFKIGLYITLDHELTLERLNVKLTFDAAVHEIQLLVFWMLQHDHPAMVFRALTLLLNLEKSCHYLLKQGKIFDAQKLLDVYKIIITKAIPHMFEVIQIVESTNLELVLDISVFEELHKTIYDSVLIRKAEPNKKMTHGQTVLPTLWCGALYNLAQRIDEPNALKTICLSYHAFLKKGLINGLFYDELDLSAYGKMLDAYVDVLLKLLKIAPLDLSTLLSMRIEDFIPVTSMNIDDSKSLVLVKSHRTVFIGILKKLIEKLGALGKKENKQFAQHLFERFTEALSKDLQPRELAKLKKSFAQ